MDIDIKNIEITKVTHCNNCEILLNNILKEGLSALNNSLHHCCYKSDDINKYLLQCLEEASKDRIKNYIKPTIITDGKYDHYNSKYIGSSDYQLTDFILCDEADILLVYGEGGIGKSSFLNQLYMELSLYSLNHDKTILPIFIRAEGFGGELLPDDWLKSKLADKYKYINFEPAFFNPNLQVVFFVDAINDIQYCNYKDFYDKLNLWSNYFKECFNKYTNIKFVVSSRRLDALSVFEDRNFKRLYLQPLDDYQVQEYIRSKNLSTEKTSALIYFINENIELPFLRIPFFLNKIISANIEKITNKTSVIDVFVNSIFQKTNNSIRNNIIRVEHLKKVNEDIRFGNITFTQALSILAYNNTVNNRMDISREELSELLREDKQQFLDIAITNSIITRDGSKFFHPIFQEYFSAKFIYYQLQETYTLEDLFASYDGILLVNALKHVYNFVENKEYFINLLLTGGKSAVAAECLLEEKDTKLKKKVAESIIKEVEKKDSINDNWNLGLLLGKLGDIRIVNYLHKDYCEPSSVTIKRLGITVGRYPVTNLEYSMFVKDGGYNELEYWMDPTVKKWFNFEERIESICSFWHDIQNKLNKKDAVLEFCIQHNFDKEFIANLVYFKTIKYDELVEIIRDLYSEEKSLKPLMWENPLYNNPSQPVVGVSIYEAMAYCNWLGSKTGKPYRLLTEIEWENIACVNKRIYSYGNSCNHKYSNTCESNIKRIIPVGMCKKNCTKEGVFDLTGNIFEWTSTIYNKSSLEKDMSFNQYVCKGGSWIQDYSRAKSNYTGRGMGWARNLDIGFRVCFDGE